jgi:hypothetical protein
VTFVTFNKKKPDWFKSGSAGRTFAQGATMNNYSLIENKPQDTNKFNALLTHLWRGAPFGYFWTIDGDGEKQTHWRHTKNENSIGGEYHAVYFSVNPANNSYGWRPDRRAHNNDIGAINCFYSEFDFKDFDSREACEMHIDALPLPPSVIIFSGGGYHAYWLLEETLTLTEDNRARVKRVQAEWVKFVGGDVGAKDLARVLRVPGFENRKEKYAPDYPTVAMVRCDLGQMYTFGELTAACVDNIPKPRANKTADIKRFDGHGIHPYVGAILESTAAKFAALTDDRKGKNFGYARMLGNWSVPGNLDRQTAYNALREAGQRNGVIQDYGLKEFDRRFNDGWQTGLAEPSQIPPARAHDQRVDDADGREYEQWLAGEYNRQFSAPDTGVNVRGDSRYFSEMYQSAGQVEIWRAGTGTGKTYVANERAKGERVLAVANTRRLVRNMCEKLDLEYYEDFDGQPDLLRMVDRLGICAPSVQKLIDDEQNVPLYRVVIIDESENVARTFFSKLMPKGDDIRKNTLALMAVVRSCLAHGGKVIFADANAGQITQSFAELLTQKKPAWIVNDYRGKRPPVTLTNYDESAIAAMAVDAWRQWQAGDGLPVFVATDAGPDTVRRIAETVERSISETVTRFSALDGSPEAAACIENTLALTGIVVGNSSIATGIDIQIECSVFGLFGGQSVDIDTLGQLINRTRKAQAVTVGFKNTSGDYERGDFRVETVARKEIGVFDRLHELTLKSAAPNGEIVQAHDEISTGINELWSIWRARRNLTNRNPKLAFKTLLEAWGHTVIETTIAGHEQTAELMQEVRDRLVYDDNVGICTLPAMAADEYERKVKAGTVTREHKLRFARGQYETFLDREIDLDDADFVELARKRKWLTTIPKLARLHRPDDELAAGDYAAIGTGFKHLVRFRLKQKHLYQRAFKLVFGTEKIEEIGDTVFTYDELEDFWNFVQKQSGDLDLFKRLTGIRARQLKSKRPALNVLRSMLASIGLKLESDKRQVDGARERIYYIDGGALALALKMARNYNDAVSKNGKKYRKYTILPNLDTRKAPPREPAYGARVLENLSIITSGVGI